MSHLLLSASSMSTSSSTATSSLFRLPSALLSHICSYLSIKELLVTVAHTSQHTRRLLTPACFSAHELELEGRELLLLSAYLAPSSAASLRSFHSRILSGCRLSVHLDYGGIVQLLDALDHFPACSALDVQCHGPIELTDAELHALLHHPTTVGCSTFTLEGACRHSEELVPADSEQSRAALRDVRAQQAGNGPTVVVRRKRFDWADIRLPSIAVFHLLYTGQPRYTGGAAFLRAHTGLVELDISTLLVSVSRLTRLFQDPAVLPHLARLSLHNHIRRNVERVTHDLAPLVSALATVAVAATGRPRPVEWLQLHLSTSPHVFAAAAPILTLTRLVVQVSTAKPAWLEDWSDSPEALTAGFPQLQECTVHTDWIEPDVEAVNGRRVPAARDIRPFLQYMASRPLQRLHITCGEPVAFDTAAMAELARCGQLRELNLSTGLFADADWMDWRDAALFAPLTAGCFPYLRAVVLQTLKLSAESVVAIASAAPQLHEFTVSSDEPSCHPAVICAIVSGYCEHIEEVSVDDQAKHVWSNVRAVEIADAYNSAVAASRRRVGYRPFTRLRYLYTMLCWCTPPSVWHLLLLLLRAATRLRCVSLLSTNDPLVVCALSYLPALTELAEDCLWPPSFATYMTRRSLRTDRYRFLACQHVGGCASDACPGPGTAFRLTDIAEQGYMQPLPIPLRPRADLFGAYQRWLPFHYQPVLARWASGHFYTDDERLSAAETVMGTDELAMEAGDGHVLCPHPHLFYSRAQLDERYADEYSEDEVLDMDSDGSGSSDEEGKADEEQKVREDHTPPIANVVRLVEQLKE